MRSLAVIPVAKGVLRAELMKLEQSEDENFRAFAARVKGKAETCSFSVEGTCVCGLAVTTDYTAEMMRDVLLAGIANLDIRQEALSCEDVSKKPINDLIGFVERREMSRSAAASSNSLSAISTFKREKRQPAQHAKSAVIPCPTCSKPYKQFKLGRLGWNRKPFQNCFDCWQKERASQANLAANEQFSDDRHDEASEQVSKYVLSHIIMRREVLRGLCASSHPRVKFRLNFKCCVRVVMVDGIADTGAQSNLWGLREFVNKGFKVKDLRPVEQRIKAANDNPLNIIGAFMGHFSAATPDNSSPTCQSIVYVSDSVSDFYLSYDTMKSLGIINQTFPTIGSYGNCSEKARFTPHDNNPKYVRSTTDGPVQRSTPHSDATLQCSCPLRTDVPKRPKQLRFEPKPMNNHRMKEWLLDKFSSSTFNVCPHKPLQQMAGPPLKFHVDPQAEPQVCRKPSPVSLHWQERVHADLLRDEALGVIERVPYGETPSWCHRMVLDRKSDGSPRRTVDLSPLNQYCKRELYSSESPFHLARRVPGNTWKTVTDAWNGYRSVPLRESDRHLTTFITPFGRWRYKRAPQGFLSSGDGYNRRFEAILSEFPRRERCVDDTIY